jgi:DnaD/phage-associated family protein
MSEVSKLLINEPPLMVLPTLAKKIGLNQAVILQQIHYWLSASKHERDGYKWLYNSYNQWAEQFPWLSPRAVQKHILALEKMGYLISDNFNIRKVDQTKWYRIDYTKLVDQCEKSNNGDFDGDIDGEESNTGGEESNTGNTENSPSVPDTTPEIITETRTESNNGKFNIFSVYESNIGLLTPMVSEELKDIEKEYPVDWIEDAIKVSVQANVRKLSYIKAVLSRWRTDGRNAGKKVVPAPGADKFAKQKWAHVVKR